MARILQILGMRKIRKSPVLDRSYEEAIRLDPNLAWT